MILPIGEQIEVLRDEALLTHEYGADAPGAEVFDALLVRIASLHETEPDLDMSLRDALNRRLAWGESASTIIVDCDTVCKRLLLAVERSFREPEDIAKVACLIADVSCSAARHLARSAVQRASAERALQRRERMAQRQISRVIDQQEDRIKNYSQESLLTPK